MKKYIFRFAFIIIVAALYFAYNKYHQAQQHKVILTPVPTHSSKPDTPSDKKKYNASIPNYVIEVYEYVTTHDEAPDGYVGGRIFQNREKKLPKSTPDNQKIKYQEWDVFPHLKGKNRGAERLITGSNRTAYYTKDHYKNFIPLSNE